MKRGAALAVGSLLFGATPAYAADVQSWLDAQVGYAPLHDLELSIEPKLRTRLDSPRLEAAILELGAAYEVTRWFEVGVGYRPMYERDGDEDLVLRHRMQLDLQLQADLGRLRFAYRARLQEKFRPTSKDGMRTKMRHRVKVTYRGIEGWRPAVSAEQFFGLGDFDALERDTLRLTFGVSHRIAKRQRVEAYYRVEMLHADEDDPVLHVIGLGWSFELPSET